MKNYFATSLCTIGALLFSHTIKSQQVRISDSIDEGIACYKIETTTTTYFLDKEGGGFTSLVDQDGNDWLNYNDNLGSAGKFRGIPNSGELHPGYSGGSSHTDAPTNVWLDSATITSSRNGEAVEWTFFPTHVQMVVKKLDQNDGKFWILYEGTPGGTIEATDSLHLSTGETYSITANHPFGKVDIINVSDRAIGSEWMYVSDTAGDKSFFMAVTNDVAADTYYLLEDNMTVMGFGRSGSSPLKKEVNTTMIMGIIESRDHTQVTNTIDLLWNQNAAPLSMISSDAFSSTSLDTDVWKLEDPNGSASYELTGNQLSVSIPGGSRHDVRVYRNAATRLMQPVLDTDFEIEVKFDSKLTEGMQHGVLIEEHDRRYLHFDIYHQGGNTFITSSYKDFLLSTNQLQTNLFSEQPGWIRINRTGDHWIYSYSLDGSAWTVATAFEQPLQVRQVGPFLGSFGTNPPAHTMLVDYFFNRASSEIPKDESIDLTPPTISDVTVTTTPNAATINWVTDEAASSKIAYGLHAGFGLSEGLISVRKAHQLTLTGLEQGTTYHFQVSGEDAVGNASQHPALTFTTGIDLTPPTLDVWYGPVQQVGHLGVAQGDFNLVGTVSDTNGIASLTYNLNGGAFTPLTIGNRPDGFGDGRRLAKTGDFNADIPVEAMTHGINAVILNATDNIGNMASDTIFIKNNQGSSSLPYSVNWSEVTNPQDVGQYVDGKWKVENGGLRIEETGYDRLFLIGDLSWVDYEVTVPVTYNGRDLKNGPKSGAAGLGIVMRFAGHVTGGVRNFPDTQPKWGYLPFGAIGWVRWVNGSSRQYHPGDSDETVNYDQFPMIPGNTYWMKMRCVTLEDSIPGIGTTRYSYKVWSDGDEEPADWDWQVVQNSEHALRNGGFALLAHHVDATFGDVSVTSLADPTDVTPPSINDITVNQNQKRATISWTTDEYTLSTINHGSDSSNREAIFLGNLSTTHSVSLEGLELATTYSYTIQSTDVSRNTTVSEELIFITPPVTSVTSDDFSSDSLNTSLWKLEDPQGGSSANMTGSQLSLSVPGGSPHDPWTRGNTSTRLMQEVSDVDFEMSVKFESALSKGMSYGLLVENSDSKYLRFDIHHNKSFHAFSAFLDGRISDVKGNLTLDNVAGPVWMKVTRVGHQWTYAYSLDGQFWETAASFRQEIEVNEVGLFAGNFGSNPEHTAIVDYFFNDSSPISPEDENSPPLISNIQVVTSANEAIVTWATDQATTSQVKYGLEPLAYTDSITTTHLSKNHRIFIEGLASSTNYHFQIVSSDGTTSSTSDLTFTTESLSSIISDDFSSEALNETWWELEDPVGGASWEMTGSQVKISIPGGVAHDPWVGENTATRLVQSVSNLDFEVEVKFESQVMPNQLQGLIVKESDHKYLRFDLFRKSSSQLFAALIDGNSSNIKTNQSISPAGSTWIKVNRSGDDWTYSYSLNGVEWMVAATFHQPIFVSQVGILVGNFGTNPVTTSVVDYFFNNDERIDPEDEGAMDLIPPVISDVMVTSTADSAIVSWTTDELTYGLLDYGLSTSYSNGAQVTHLRTSHRLVLHPLLPDTTYFYQITSIDGNGNETISSTFSFVTEPESPPGHDFISDDFHSNVLDSDLWTVEDPIGGATVETTGSQLSITVPAGSNHDPWKNNNTAVRVMQSVNDVDVSIEAKFDSDQDSRQQLQGLLFEAEDGSFLRFGKYFTGTKHFIFCALISGNSSTIYTNTQISASNPLWMRVERSGNNWIYSYTIDGTNWTVAAFFVHDLNLAKIGPYGGNTGGSNAPETVVLVDYLSNLTPPSSDVTLIPDQPLQARSSSGPNEGKGEIKIQSKPFGIANEALKFEISTTQTQYVHMHVHDLTGRRYFETLYDGVMNAHQRYEFSLNRHQLPEGLYLIRIIGNDFNEQLKVYLK
ncbi:MAG: fibronectin type III domain-containing protein [Bacteroidota bacterium]